MAVAKINVNTDAEVKREVEILLDKMGLTMTTAINMYLKRIVMEGGIPFEVTTRVPNSVTVAALDEFEEMKNNPQKYKRYPSFNAAISEVL